MCIIIIWVTSGPVKQQDGCELQRHPGSLWLQSNLRGRESGSLEVKCLICTWNKAQWKKCVVAAASGSLDSRCLVRLDDFSWKCALQPTVTVVTGL